MSINFACGFFISASSNNIFPLLPVSAFALLPHRVLPLRKSGPSVCLFVPSRLFIVTTYSSLCLCSHPCDSFYRLLSRLPQISHRLIVILVVSSCSAQLTASHLARESWFVGFNVFACSLAIFSSTRLSFFIVSQILLTFWRA